MLTRTLFPAVLAGAALLVGCEAGFDAHPDNTSARQTSSVSGGGSASAMDQQILASNDRSTRMDAATFVTRAASSGLYEVQSSKLALDRQIPADLQSFARRMIDEHSKVNDQLRALTRQNGLNVPDQMLPPEQQMYNKLQATSADQFAEVYRNQQIKAHEQAIKLFLDARDQLDNTYLRDFAAEKLPVLRDHRRMLMPAESPNQ